MEKQRSLFNLIVTSVFVGILLSCSIFYLVTCFVGQRYEAADACFDGTLIEGNSPVHRFERAVYQNSNALTRIRNAQYRLFGIVEDENVLAGKNGYLFEVENKDCDYNYLADYLGELSFTEEEYDAIAANLEARRAMCAEQNIAFLVVILPNTQTVYSENMPAYLGNIRETRLDRLEVALEERGFTSFINLSDDLALYKDEGPLYNNTENSLNALGCFYTYRIVYECFADTVMAKTHAFERGDLSFYQHNTTGKAIARAAGLADVAQNLTVSLSNDTKLHYHIQIMSGGMTKTRLLPIETIDVSETPSLLLQFSDTWERLQMEPYFSNTFLDVTYQTSLVHDEDILKDAAPDAVIQFIYEDELSYLLPGSGMY